MTLEGWHVGYLDPFDVIFLLDGTTLRPADNSNFAYFNDPAYNSRIAEANRLHGDARGTAFGLLDVDIARNAAPGPRSVSRTTATSSRTASGARPTRPPSRSTSRRSVPSGDFDRRRERRGGRRRSEDGQLHGLPCPGRYRRLPRHGLLCDVGRDSSTVRLHGEVRNYHLRPWRDDEDDHRRRLRRHDARARRDVLRAALDADQRNPDTSGGHRAHPERRRARHDPAHEPGSSSAHHLEDVWSENPDV